MSIFLELKLSSCIYVAMTMASNQLSSLKSITTLRERVFYHDKHLLTITWELQNS